MKRLLLLLTLCFFTSALTAQSEVYSFRPNLVIDEWNKPVLPYLATVPAGMAVRSENIRAMIKTSALEALKVEAAGQGRGRVVRRQVVSSLDTEAAVVRARSFLVPEGDSPAVDVFKLAVGYIDGGLLSILEVLAKWQCNADLERCPESVAGRMDVLIGRGGKIMKTEVFLPAAGGGAARLIATITYEIQVGTEVRTVVLRSRKLPVLPVP